MISFLIAIMSTKMIVHNNSSRANARATLLVS
jgi:hypothetical protein